MFPVLPCNNYCVQIVEILRYLVNTDSHIDSSTYLYQKVVNLRYFCYYKTNSYRVGFEKFDRIIASLSILYSPEIPYKAWEVHTKS